MRLASVVQGTLPIERLLIINMCMVWEQQLQFNGARMCPRSYSSDPKREGPSEASPPSVECPPVVLKECLCRKKINCPASGWGGTENRSGSQRGKVICQLKMCLLTDKPIKGGQILMLMRLEERKRESYNICLV